MVELMVVIVIIGLMAAVVVLNMPSPVSDLEKGTQKLAARLQLAAEESILAGQVTGVRVSSEGYEFLAYRRGRWIPMDLPGDEWPEGVMVRLVRDNLPVDLAGNQSEKLPSLWFDPLGDQLSFSIEISELEHKFKVSGEENGEIVITRTP